MDFLAKTLGLKASIPYKLGAPIQHDSLNNKNGSLWNIYDATADKDGKAVTVFEINKKEPAYENYTNSILNAMAKQVEFSILPGVLTTVETIENDNGYYIITEHVTLLRDVFDTLSQKMKICGIFQIATALKHINHRGKNLHAGLSFESVFVNDSMEWKLGGFENSVYVGNPKNTDLIHKLYGYYLLLPVEPPELKVSAESFLRNESSETTLVKPDSYFLGCFICNVLKKPSDSLDKVMKSLKIEGLPLKSLLDSNLRARISIEQYLRNGEMTYFATDEISSYSKFNEIALLNLAEKLEVYKLMISSEIPSQFLENKVLQDVVRTFDTLTSNENNIQTILIYLMFMMIKNSKPDSISFEMLFKPVYFKAFLLTDRAIRVLLLKILPQINERITKHEVQDKIYPNLISGFQDTDITVRRETLLSISSISNKITDRQLNNDLLRFLAKLQIDQNPELRANTVLCLTKLADIMQPITRTGVLVTAFGKALKDKDNLTRMCAVKGFENSIEYFSPETCCSKVLSALAPALLDPEMVIRNEAEKTFELYMEKIKVESESIANSSTENEDLSGKMDELHNSIKNLSLENMGYSILGSISSLPTPTSSVAPESRINSNSNLAQGFGSYAKSEKYSNYDGFDIDDDDGDGWGFSDDEDTKVELNPKTTTSIKPKTSFTPVTKKEPLKLATKSTNVGNSSNKKPLVLGKKKTPVKLNLTAEPIETSNDDGWGDGW